MSEIKKEVCPAYFNFMFDWDYKIYLSVGGYGSAKSYHTAFKIILKLFEEVRKALVVREVYDTITESCYDLIKEILADMDLLTDDPSYFRKHKDKVLVKKSPMEFKFPNGSRIIFKGMDSPLKVKSINGVSIVWLEECSEIKYAGYKELLGRLRTPNVSLHFFLTCNPVDKDNWVYRHFFKRLDDDGKEIVILDDEKLYEKKCLVKNNVYYLHTVPEDNKYLPKDYVDTLEDLKNYDMDLYRVAKLGRFGLTGTRVLPQIVIAENAKAFKTAILDLPITNHYFGFDFGFEESYNAVLSMAVDLKNSILYIYDEIYKNKITDDKFALSDEMQKLKKKLNFLNENKANRVIVADNEDPKAITYYRQQGFPIRKCRNKFAGSRLSNTRKVKRFKHIIISPKCKNTIRELENLTYAKDNKGNVIYDKFNIDPHTFSAIWYALDTVTVADYKLKSYNSVKGGN